jgi:hypothetical protein
MPKYQITNKPRLSRLVGRLDRVQDKFDNPVEDDKNETDEQIEKRLIERFEVLTDMTVGALAGSVRAMIVSGPGGLGKSYTVENTLEDYDPEGSVHKINRGYSRATGLYRLLYQNQHKGNVLVLDDIDAIFNDETSLNILKAACDSGRKRVISYLTEGKMLDDETAETIPKSFEYNGSVIFITNKDFDSFISTGHRLAPHMEAMISRAHYIDMGMKNRRDYMIQIRLKIREGLLDNIGLDDTGKQDVIRFIDDNYMKLRELSLRMALKVGSHRATNSSNWMRNARVTCCK